MKIIMTSDGPGRLVGTRVELIDVSHHPVVDLAAAADAPATRTLELSDCHLLPPVAPRNLYAIGLNYKAHAEEANFPLPDHPLPLVLRPAAVVGPDAEVVIPTEAPEAVDYEAELVIVIGEEASEVAPDDALRHVAGLTLGNDVSARDIALRAMLNREFEVAWSKAFDGFKPLGPVLATLDEFDDLGDLDIRASLNGEVVQDSTSADMIFDLAQIVSYVSRFVTLHPGDAIYTGTPGGVGMSRGRMLRAGDVVTVSNSVLGSLRTTFVTKEPADV